MEIKKIAVRDFDCRQIFECGQSFRFELAADSWWQGVAGGKMIAVRNDDSFLYIKGASEADVRNYWVQYFDLERDYGALKKDFAAADPYLAEAVEAGGGIRILKQEPFETLISFIISANNNIPRIRGCIERLCRNFGAPVACPWDAGKTFYAFPTPEALAAATAEEISVKCHTGYRSAYIVESARRYLETGGAMTDLRGYAGVGPKVEACVALFAGLRTDAFPVDVWVRRVLEEFYFDHRPTEKEVLAFVSERFGKMAGFAQQYLFYWRRLVDENGLNTQDIGAKTV